MLLPVSSTLRQAGGPGAGGQFQEASVVWHTVPALCGGTIVVPCTVEGARLGPNVPSAICCCLYLLLSSKPVCSAAAELHQQTASSRQSQSARFADFLAASLLLPQSRCQRTMSTFSNNIRGTELQIGYGWHWSPIISYTCFYNEQFPTQHSR